jgi:hypothetical protein
MRISDDADAKRIDAKMTSRPPVAWAFDAADARVKLLGLPA